MMRWFKRLTAWFDSLFSDALAESAEQQSLSAVAAQYVAEHPYTELTGTVVSVGRQDDQTNDPNWVEVVVRTDQGEYTGMTLCPPQIGYTAVVRVFGAGDNHIISWARP